MMYKVYYQSETLAVNEEKAEQTADGIDDISEREADNVPKRDN